MNYADQKLFADYFRLQLQIAAAKNPAAVVDLTPAGLRANPAAKRLRGWFERLSPRGKQRARHYFATQIQGVRDVMRKAKASGEDFTLADLEIEAFDVETGERVPDAPTLEQAEPEAGA